jgi:hypothetical protein
MVGADMTEITEADHRPLAARSCSQAVSSGVQTSQIISKWVVNSTAAGTFNIRTLDGSAISMGTIPVGLFQFDIQGDMATWGGTATVIGFFDT